MEEHFLDADLRRVIEKLQEDIAKYDTSQVLTKESMSDIAASHDEIELLTALDSHPVDAPILRIQMRAL